MKLELKYWKGDLFGGLTTGVVALPLALAFGVSSGLQNGAQAGLYGAIILGMIAAIFGGTKPQVSGPTGPMTVVAAGFITIFPNNPEYLFAAVSLGGLMQISFGILRLGHYIRYIPQSVISGFMTGIGVIVFSLQVLPLIGAPSKPGPVQSWVSLPEALSSDFNSSAFLLGLITIALIYIIPRISKALPAPLIALFLVTLFSEMMKFDVPKIDLTIDGLPSFSLQAPSAEALPQIIIAALTLAILGALDTLLGSVVVDQVTNTRHDSDKELVGQGLGNAVAGIFGSLPGAGATMRTLLNIRCGGTTGLSGVIHSLLLIAIVLGLSKYVSYIPLSVLAGILVTVGFAIIDYKGLKLLPKMPLADRVVLILVLSLTVFVDLITAVQMGFLLATLLFLKNLADRELTRSGELTPMIQSEEPAAKELADKIQVIQAEGPIFFGTSEAFVEAFEGESSSLRAIIIRMPRVPVIDLTGAFALREFVARMKRRDIVVALSGLPEGPKQVLRDLGIIPTTIAEELVFPTLAEAVTGLNDHIVSDPAETLVPQAYLPKVGG